MEHFIPHSILKVYKRAVSWLKTLFRQRQSLILPMDDTLRSYDNLVIALDADATGKSIRYQQYLNTFVPTRIVMLEKDLKDMTRAQINDLFTWE